MIDLHPKKRRVNKELVVLILGVLLVLSSVFGTIKYMGAKPPSEEKKIYAYYILLGPRPQKVKHCKMSKNKLLRFVTASEEVEMNCVNCACITKEY